MQWPPLCSSSSRPFRRRSSRRFGYSGCLSLPSECWGDHHIFPFQLLTLRTFLSLSSNFLGIAGDVNLGTFGYCDRLSFESASLTTCSGTSYPYGIVLPSIVPETYQQTYDNIFNETAVKVAIRLTIVFPIGERHLFSHSHS